MKNIISNDLKKWYLWDKIFASAIVIYSPFLFPFLLNILQLTTSQILLLESIYSAISLIFQIPTGMLADKLGYIKLLLLGYILSSIGFLLLLLSNSFFIVSSAYVLMAVGSSSINGSDIGILVNKSSKGEAVNILSKIPLLSNTTSVIAIIVGGMLATVLNIRMIFVFPFLFVLLRLFVFNHFQKKIVTSNFSSNESFKCDLRNLGQSRLTINILLVVGIIGILNKLLFVINGQFLSSINENNFLVANFFMITYLFGVVGGNILIKIKKSEYGFNRLFYKFIFLQLFTSLLLLLSIHNSIIFVSAFYAVLKPTISWLLDSQLITCSDKKHIATLMSVKSFIVLLFQTTFFWLLSNLISSISLIVAWVSVAILLSFILVIFYYNKNSVAEVNS